MRKLTALLILLFTVAATFAQQSLLVLKKNERTIRTWSKGAYLELALKNGAPLNGYFVGVVRTDSIILRTFQVQRLESSKGFVFFDTLNTGLYVVGMNEIGYGKPMRKKRSGIVQGGEYTLYAASALFATMAIVNGAKFGDKLSRSLTQAAVRGGALFAAGRILRWLGRSNYRLGDKYTMAIINLE